MSGGNSDRLSSLPAPAAHCVAVGETVLADRTAVLVVHTSRSAVMVLHDRARRLAAAAHFALPDSEEGVAVQAESVPVALFDRLLSLGCRPENLEIYVVGPGMSTEIGPDAELPAGLGGRMALACQPSARAPARRVEFSVDTGRMVVERSEDL